MKVCNTTCMCIPDSRYGLTLAWVTSENSTMLLESDILRLFFTGPYLVSTPLCSVSGVDCPSVLPRQLLCSPLSCPVSTAFSLLSSHQLFLLPSNYQLPLSGSRRQLSFASPYHFRVRRDFMSKNPLSGFAPKQTIESSALAAYPHSATVQRLRKCVSTVLRKSYELAYGFNFADKTKKESRFIGRVQSKWLSERIKLTPDLKVSKDIEIVRIYVQISPPPQVGKPLKNVDEVRTKEKFKK